MFDILIKNGFVVDGTGAPGRRCDIALHDGKVAAMSLPLSAKARRIIDADGLHICPGLIDCHSHTDVTVRMNLRFESTIRQGITTEVVGNCGNSDSPFQHVKLLEASDSGRVGDRNNTRPLHNYMQHLEGLGLSANIAWLVGHNTIRRHIGVFGPHISAEELRIMQSSLRQAFEDGAVGFSSGLEFEPGRQSHADELMSLCSVVGEYGGIYTSHIRNRDAKVIEALDEFLHTISAHKIRGQVSHLNIRHNTHAPKNAFELCAARLQAARDAGLDVFADMTPLNYGIGMMSGILPEWLTSAKPHIQYDMLGCDEVRARLRRDCDRYWRFIANGEWERVRVQYSKAFPQISGLTFPEISTLWGRDCWDCYFDIYADAVIHSDDVVLVSYLFTDEHLRETISHPLYMLAVDGYSTATEGDVTKLTNFPLHYIGMTRFLTAHVKNGTLKLEEAVRKATSMPAAHFRLGKRGLLAEGYIADVCIFDYERLNGGFDLTSPPAYAQGMEYVFVRGEVVLDGGVHTGAKPGKNLRRLWC